jgi:DNA gyrase subunit A
MVLQVIREETKEIKERYGDDRMTEIIDQDEDLDIEDLIADEDMAVHISHKGYIKRNPISFTGHRGAVERGLPGCAQGRGFCRTSVCCIIT